ncbi:TetR/AcrR family transcriptional regulator [Saccharopolyspora sp. K220]|uniref:TetR/AcrR family transcriptional regulator n=1 Tax=Saccharopolyspora soli TaxID=2926618 RepID=UPI001F55BF55|nr:TetR/AcrR family transcriptional regulator [Saccharopolyspora soli]MCI2423025.1 TetR/AcrR family transcriptional regulator [Saccharopolyspora soli]
MDARERILHAAARLLTEAGGEPVSTRAICSAAGVGAPTLYHHFGDKAGLFDAVVTHGFEAYLAEKRATPSSGDPVEDLARGWDAHVEFGRTHPAFYTLMYGSAKPGKLPAAAGEVHAELVKQLAEVARAGRLQVEVELAAGCLEAGVVGVTLQAITQPEDPDAAMKSALVRDALLDVLIVGRKTPTKKKGTSAVAAQLLVLIEDGADELVEAEVALLRHWLARLSGRTGA